MQTLIGVVLLLLSSVTFMGVDYEEYTGGTNTLFTFGVERDGETIPLYTYVYYGGDYWDSELLGSCEFIDVPCPDRNALELSAVLVWADVIDFFWSGAEQVDWLVLSIESLEDGSFVINGCFTERLCGEGEEESEEEMNSPAFIHLPLVDG